MDIRIARTVGRIARGVAHAGVVAALISGLTRAVGAQPAASGGDRLAPRALVARRLHGPAPLVDGRLDDAAWRADDWPAASVATDFVQTRPAPGRPATFRTEARVAFDDAALYVAVRAFDPHPDSIVAPYVRRDDETTSDWIFIEIDGRRDRRTAASLGVNPRGVQVDGMFLNDRDYDVAWNAVWASAARVDSAGWTAEYRIPFSQLALGGRRVPDDPAGPDPVIGLNVYRYVTRLGESSNWAARLPTHAGIVSHFQELRGVVAPRGTLGLEAVPYTAARAARRPALGDDPAGASLPHGGGVFAGVDVRARPTPGLTLTATVRPDFGQVEADPSEINLTASESFFAERRPFFTEGADVFAFNHGTGTGLPFRSRSRSFRDESPFYSRRVGRAPRGAALAGLTDDAAPGARLLDAPAATDVLAAAKLAGRTDGGWMLGALVAATDRETARVRDGLGLARDVPVEPGAGLLVARAERSFRGGASAAGGLLTAVRRVGLGRTDGALAAAPLAGTLPADALVGGLDARHRVAGGTIELSGFAAASRIAGTPAAIRLVETSAAHRLLRPDAPHLAAYRRDSLRTALGGFAAQIAAARPGGHWIWQAVAHAVSPGFETNDAGFQRESDWLLAAGAVRYEQFRPGRLFRRWSAGLDEAGAGWSFGGERRAAAAAFGVSGDLRSEWGGNLSAGGELSALSTEALRGGPALRLPPRLTWSAGLHSDTRRRAQLFVNGAGHRETSAGGWGLTLGTRVDARLADRVSVGVGPALADVTTPWQFVAAPPGAPPVVARLRQRTLSLVGRADVTLAPRLTAQLYAEPLVGGARYDRFAEATEPAAADPARRVRPLAAPPAGVGDPSFGARSLVANVVARWEYRPGSALFVVWSEGRQATAVDAAAPTGTALRDLGRAPASDVLLVKWSYWWAR